MCNLYSVTKGQQAIRKLYRVAVDVAGNMPPLPGIFPDQMAPVVRNGTDGRELAMLRWGFPSPPGVPGKRAVTDIRNTGSSYWRAWMQPQSRCLVPVTASCEYAAGKPAVRHWFALGGTTTVRLRRPVAAVDGHARHQDRPGRGRAPAVRVPHLCAERRRGGDPSKAMPVILTITKECDAWMSTPIDEALELQRPLADGLLSVVTQGEKEDPPTSKGKKQATLLL